MPFFNSNGTHLYYEDTGKGFPLVLLHGLTSNHEMFYREIAFFKEKYRVIALDARGHGNSDRPEQYTLQEHVQDVIGLLDHLGLNSIYLIGVSMGSYIAQGVASEVPDRVKKLLLVATKSHGQGSSMKELMAEYADEMEGMNAIEKMSHASTYMFHDQEAVKEWTSETAKNSKQQNMREQKIASEALKDFDFRPQLDKISAETLVISGTHDGLNPPAKGRETAKLIPEATFMEFKRSGHAPNVEQARLFLGIAENFLE